MIVTFVGTVFVHEHGSRDRRYRSQDDYDE